VVAFVVGQAKRERECGDGLLRRSGPTSLLEPRVEVGRHVRQAGDLFSTEPARSPASGSRQSDVAGLQCLAPSAQEVGDTVTVHCSNVTTHPGIQPGTGCPWMN
jgi:hypothetical protein